MCSPRIHQFKTDARVYGREGRVHLGQKSSDIRQEVIGGGKEETEAQKKE